MRRHRLVVVWSLVLLLTGSLLTFRSLSAPTYPSREKCERIIHAGMKADEVLYSLRPEEMIGIDGGFGGASAIYDFPDGYLCLGTDSDNRVTCWSFMPKPPPSLGDRFRRLLPW
jgi:hypothetical protein